MSVTFDHDRSRRIGMPEAVLCLGKSDEQLRDIVTEVQARSTGPILFTRMTPAQFEAAAAHCGGVLSYDAESQTATLFEDLPDRGGPTVLIVTAGTSDLRVAAEARRALVFQGHRATVVADVGVAGLWRILQRADEIAAADVVIVIAGMDGALASVVGGLTSAPVIAVPTSTGYGASRGGETALSAMLASCAQGVSVMNIDNGFGAACAAIRILLTKETP